MYYSGINPHTMKKVSVARSKNEKLAQRKFFFWYKKEFKNEIISELSKSNREDLMQELFGKTQQPKHKKHFKTKKRYK